MDPPLFFCIFLGFSGFVVFIIFIVACQRLCQSCCCAKPKPRMNQARTRVRRRHRDVESGHFSSGISGFDAPPAYDDVMFASGIVDSSGDDGATNYGCDTGGGGFDSGGGGCDSGGGGCDSGGGGCGGID